MVDRDLFSTIPENPNRGPNSLVLDEKDDLVCTDVVVVVVDVDGGGGGGVGIVSRSRRCVGVPAVEVFVVVFRALNSIRGFNRRLTWRGDTMSRL